MKHLLPPFFFCLLSILAAAPASAEDLHPGIIGTDDRVSPYSGQVIAYRDGVAIEIGELGFVKSRLQPQPG